MKWRIDPALGLGVLAVVSAGALGLLAVVDPGRVGPEPSPPMPLTVTALVTPRDARASLAPRGGRIEPSGRLTILSVPTTPGTLAPRDPGKAEPDEQARPASPVPMDMLAGIRGFYRSDPLPPAERDRLIVTTLEYVVNRAPLVLVDGCFRFGGARGPLAIFPPESRLAMIDGYLVVGPPGLPARFSARVGELVEWEGKPLRAIAEKAKEKVRERCGPAEVIAVTPWSASVRKAESDSRTTSELARRLGLSFPQALRLLRRCGDPARRAIEGGPVSQTIEEACRIASPRPVSPPSPPPLPERRMEP